MNISVYVHEDDMFEGWSQEDLDAVDLDASVQKYVDLYFAALKAAYPDATISVHAGPEQSTIENSDDDPRINEEVRSLDVYADKEWEVLR